MRETEEDIQAWLDSVADRDPYRRLQAELYFQELTALLVRWAGPPPGSIPEQGVSPPTYWWDFYPELWVRFCVEDRPGKWFGLFGGRTRRITVLQLRDAQPFEPE